VLFTMVLNPQNSSISPPGVAMDIPISVKLGEFKKFFPQTKVIGTVYTSQFALRYEEALDACDKLGLSLVAKKINSQNEFSGAVDEIIKKVDVFLMIADTNLYLPKTTEYLLIQCMQRNIPVIGLSSGYAKAGALIAFDCDYKDMGKQTAELAARILKGDLTAKKEIILPRKIKYSLNALVAERLGLKLSSEVLERAEEVFGR
ncbi:MAG: hypothetical protein JW788_01870, partial [Candidatus Omnitrophica bacterium]|nr:hypothetical protein [Candidatus Omnitrophota bacterium]